MLKGVHRTIHERLVGSEMCIRDSRYNISLTINSSGSDRPYDPVTEACMDVAVTVADWDVIEQNEDLD